MSDILLTHSYFLRFDPKQWKAQQPYPPLATLYAAAALLAYENEVAFHDMMFAAKANEIALVIKKHKPRYFIIYDDGFNYLTKMCLTNMRDAAFEMAAIAKAFGCTVIVSSSDATDHSLDYLQQNFDYIIVGEGEQTLVELINQLPKKPNDQITNNGLRYLKEGRMIETPKRENLQDLDKLSFPAWHLLDIAPYRTMWSNSKGYFSINMVTTRGCPYKCNWCAKPIYGNRYNSRSPQNVVDEIIFLAKHFGFDHIWFCDDIFGLKPGWIKEFADVITSHQLQIKFKMQSRADLLLEEETTNQETTITSLQHAGCDEVWMGAESGSQKILDAMDKGTKVEQIKVAANLLRLHKIKPCFFLQFGYTGETLNDIKLTLKLLYEQMPYDIGISVSYPLPGTKFYEQVKSRIQGKRNWKDSDELALLFTSEYPAGFYKKLQRHVHHQFRKKQAMHAFKAQQNWQNIFSLSYRIPQAFLSQIAIRKYVR